MDVNRIKLLIVTLVALLSLALGASSTRAYHNHDHNSRPQRNCEFVIGDQLGRQSKPGYSTNCAHSPFRNP